MTISILLMLIGVTIGVILFNQTQPKFLKEILIGLILSFLISFIPFAYSLTIAFYLFGLLSLIFTIYSYKNKKWLSFIIGLSTFLPFLMNVLNFPFINTMRFLMLIPILCFILALKKPKLHKGEFSILVILLAFEVGEFLQLFEF